MGSQSNQSHFSLCIRSAIFFTSIVKIVNAGKEEKERKEKEALPQTVVMSFISISNYRIVIPELLITLNLPCR